MGTSKTLGDVKRELVDVKQQLSDHFDTLNENTSELISVYEYVGEVDMKIDKLTERIDALQALVLSQSSSQPTKSVRLNQKERGVFHALRAGDKMTSVEIGKLVGLTPDLAAQTLYCLKQKGIDVVASTNDGVTYYAVQQAVNNGLL